MKTVNGFYDGRGKRMNRKRVAAACLAAVLLGADMISITVPNYVYAAESEDYD